MSDPGKIIVVMTVIGSIVYTIKMIIGAFQHAKKDKSSLEPGMSAVADERMTRLEQAVDAIAFEVERISEGQRFTTRLLSEQSRADTASPRRELSANTPH